MTTITDAPPADTPKSDNPDSNPHRGVVDQTIDALGKRLVGRADKERLRDAIDRSDRADQDATGRRIAGNDALGRISSRG